MKLLRSCLKKKAYEFVEEAEAHVERVRNLPNCYNPERLGVYKCEFCDRFHVGHVRVGRTPESINKENRALSPSPLLF